MLADSGAASVPGGRIAFAAESGLYVISPGGGTARKIIGTRAGDAQPVWSPDGRRLAFVRPGSEVAKRNTDIYVINANGGVPRRLTFSAG